MNNLERMVCGVAATAAAVALSACAGTEANVVSKPAQTALAAQRLQVQLEPSARQPGLAPSTPRFDSSPGADPRNELRHKFQLCRLDSQHCMALDPRPFVLCPASDDSVCDAKGSVMLLGTGKAEATAAR